MKKMRYYYIHLYYTKSLLRWKNKIERLNVGSHHIQIVEKKKQCYSLHRPNRFLYIFFSPRRNSTSSAIKRPSSTWDRSTNTPTETGQTCSPTLSTRFEKNTLIQCKYVIINIIYYVCYVYNAHVDTRNAAVAAT